MSFVANSGSKVLTKLCATPRPLFNGNVSVADCMPYTVFRKKTANAGVYGRLAILDEYLVDHCWLVTHDQHLDDRLS